MLTMYERPIDCKKRLDLEKRFILFERIYFYIVNSIFNKFLRKSRQSLCAYFTESVQI